MYGWNSHIFGMAVIFIIEKLKFKIVHIVLLLTTVTIYVIIYTII